MKYFALIAAVALAGCSSNPVYQDRPVTVKVPVTVPCTTPRPVQPVPIKEKTPDWNSLDVRQKAAHVGKQGLEWQTYGQELNAATAACQ